MRKIVVLITFVFVTLLSTQAFSIAPQTKVKVVNMDVIGTTIMSDQEIVRLAHMGFLGNEDIFVQPSNFYVHAEGCRIELDRQGGYKFTAAPDPQKTNERIYLAIVKPNGSVVKYDDNFIIEDNNKRLNSNACPLIGKDDVIVVFVWTNNAHEVGVSGGLDREKEEMDTGKTGPGGSGNITTGEIGTTGDGGNTGGNQGNTGGGGNTGTGDEGNGGNGNGNTGGGTNDGGTVPGYGYGDENQDHTGPPGLDIAGGNTGSDGNTGGDQGNTGNGNQGNGGNGNGNTGGGTNDGGTRPGYGYGDENQDHSGPPGLDISGGTTGGNGNAGGNQGDTGNGNQGNGGNGNGNTGGGTDDGARPGYGYGDENQDHSGPPGLNIAGGTAGGNGNAGGNQGDAGSDGSTGGDQGNTGGDTGDGTDDSGARPGYGYGDENQDHSGPPGLDISGATGDSATTDGEQPGTEGDYHHQHESSDGTLGGTTGTTAGRGNPTK